MWKRLETAPENVREQRVVFYETLEARTIVCLAGNSSVTVFVYNSHASLQSELMTLTKLSLYGFLPLTMA